MTKLTNDEILSRIKKVVTEKLNVTEDKITMEASFADDLGADSLDVVELVMAFEEEFSIEISDSDTEKLLKIKDVFDYVISKVK